MTATWATKGGMLESAVEGEGFLPAGLWVLGALGSRISPPTDLVTGKTNKVLGRERRAARPDRRGLDWSWGEWSLGVCEEKRGSGRNGDQLGGGGSRAAVKW